MISFDALPGNRSLKASLRRALAGRVPQTILLSGDDSRSLETLSTALAAGILCEADGPHPAAPAFPAARCRTACIPTLPSSTKVKTSSRSILRGASRRKTPSSRTTARAA
ncbi:MAG: hypothetical protein ACLR4Z_12740 [Butyricicoccaceae bacterium]